MALQEAGQIKISQIKTELNSSLNSLRDLSTGVGFTSPHAMSEFYGYENAPPPTSNFTNTHYIDFDGVNDYVTGTPNDPGSYPNDIITLSFWVRVDQTSRGTMIFYCTGGADRTSAEGRFIVYYHGNSNRLVAQYYINSGGHKYYQRQYPLHNAASTTGISSSTTGWVAAQRGTVDADNFTHIAVALDRTRTNVTEGMKVYWNGTELTYSVNNKQSMTSAHAFEPNFLAIGEGTHTATKPGGSIHDGALDEMYIYNAQLSASTISTIYGYGRNSENTYTTNYVTSWRFENNIEDQAGLVTLQNNGATFVAY